MNDSRARLLRLTSVSLAIRVLVTGLGCLSYEIVRNAKAQGIANEAIQEYDRKFRHYLSELQNTYMYAQSREHGIQCELIFAAANVGNVLITDLRIELRFPDGAL